MSIRLGVNIDHVATLRNARGEWHPDPIRAAKLCKEAGADGITVHLREDRRHIRDSDVERLSVEKILPLNLEMAATDEMQKIVLQTRPNACCLVPEKREELTTEGGLDVIAQQKTLAKFIAPIKEAGIQITLFIDPDIQQLEASKAIGADNVELHTGCYANASEDKHAYELQRLQAAARYAATLGLHCHAGHGLTYNNVGEVAGIKEIEELNIGHFIMGEAMFVGLDKAVKKMHSIMTKAHKRAS